MQEDAQSVDLDTIYEFSKRMFPPTRVLLAPWLYTYFFLRLLNPSPTKGSPRSASVEGKGI